jgi:alanine racemase
MATVIREHGFWGPVLVSGRRAPLVGRVSMDMIGA